MAVGCAAPNDARILRLLVGGDVAVVFCTCGTSEKRVTAQALQRKSKWQQRGCHCPTRCGQRQHKQQHRRHLRGYGVLMILLVAWGGIEPPTQGFSTLIDHVLPVHFQALAAWLKVGVRFLALHNTQG
jgi:hypothetical protein